MGPNKYLISRIRSLLDASVDTSPTLESHTELDSHANMVVLDRNCFVFDGVHGHKCDVDPFDPCIGTANKIPTVDAAVAYTCPYTHEIYVMIARNAFYVPSIDNSLTPPFILWEAEVNVSDTPEIHLTDPESRDRAIIFPDSNLLIPLSL